jgi:hypothetical protein
MFAYGQRQRVREKIGQGTVSLRSQEKIDEGTVSLTVAVRQRSLNMQHSFRTASGKRPVSYARVIRL